MAFSARNQQLLPVEHLSRISEDAEYGSCDLARDVGLSAAYNQEAFRYFLANERKRSELSDRSFLLLLVDVQQSQGNGRIGGSVAVRLFSRLLGGLRDTDVIGWYHEGRVAGAVLTHVDGASSTDVSARIRERVSQLLKSSLPAALGARLQVGVFQLPAGPAQ